MKITFATYLFMNITYFIFHKNEDYNGKIKFYLITIFLK